MTTPATVAATILTAARLRSFGLTEREEALLIEHERDWCDCEPGCGHTMPYCSSERHWTRPGVTQAPDWPCRVVCRIEGVKNAEAYWQRESQVWMATAVLLGDVSAAEFAKPGKLTATDGRYE